MGKENESMREVLSEFLGFLKYKVDAGVLTMSDVEAMFTALENGMDISGTADDFAAFYGKSKTNVTTVIDRRMPEPPRRVVLRSFQKFRRIIPESWRKPADDGKNHT